MCRADVAFACGFVTCKLGWLTDISPHVYVGRWWKDRLLVRDSQTPTHTHSRAVKVMRRMWDTILNRIWLPARKSKSSSSFLQNVILHLFLRDHLKCLFLVELSYQSLPLNVKCVYFYADSVMRVNYMKWCFCFLTCSCGFVAVLYICSMRKLVLLFVRFLICYRLNVSLFVPPHHALAYNLIVFFKDASSSEMHVHQN